MKITRTIIVFIVAGLFAVSNVAMAASATKGGEFLVLEMSDNNVAAKKLVAFLRSHGIDASLHNEDMVRVAYHGGHFMIRPRMTSNRLDRLIVYKLYRVDAIFIGDPRVQDMVTRINARYNIGTFTLAGKGRTLVVQTQVTFMDRVSEKEIMRTLKWLTAGMRTVIKKTPEFIRYVQ